MSGRRSHPRFALTTPWEGAIRLLRDVIVDQTGEDELVVICHAPGILEEELSLDLITGGVSLSLKVKVLESRPVIIEGSVRHRLRVRLLRQPAAAPPLATDERTVVGAGGTTAESL